MTQGGEVDDIIELSARRESAMNEQQQKTSLISAISPHTERPSRTELTLSKLLPLSDE
jgi:hypothetical protein